MNYFRPEEFQCPCCGRNEMQSETLININTVREAVGRPLHINSGFRCPVHNRIVGGKSDSMHLVGGAVDVSMSGMDAILRSSLLRNLMEHFNGLGVGKSFIHADIRKEKMLWIY